MRFTALLWAILLIAGCASRGSPREWDTAPYKAVVVFEWLAEAEPPGPSDAASTSGAPTEPPPPAEPAEAGKAQALARSGQLDRQVVEEEILKGLDEYHVFSDFIPATWETMQTAAVREKADLIVLVRIGSLVRWDDSATRIVPGLAVLDGVLWLGTGVGGWWVADKEFATRSDVEVSWKRPEAADARPGAQASGPATLESIKNEFGRKESLTSGDYRLSLWDRAKPWRQPLAYLVTIAVPPMLVPLKDRREVDRSLALSALEDLKRELARKLRGGYLGSGGSPFLFRLEEPFNGQTVNADRIRLRYRYQIEPGFDLHKATGLRALTIEGQSEEGSEYRTLRRYAGEELLAINEKIAENGIIEEDIEGLKPGMNLIRFVARTEFGGGWITNTVAIQRL